MTGSQDLHGRQAVITGGARGLGRAIGERLSEAGAAIAVIDLNAALSDLPEGWAGHACDLASATAQQDLARIAAQIGKADIVVANAGVVPPWRGVAELDAGEWTRVMQINVWGVAATLGAFAGALAVSGRGSAIVMASINGYCAHPKQVLYSASKHAVIGVMRAAALDLGPRGVRVNALAPGPIATEALVQRMEARHKDGAPPPDAALADLAADTALGRLATIRDVANVAYFLASDTAAGVTGKVIPVEAGLA